MDPIIFRIKQGNRIEKRGLERLVLWRLQVGILNEDDNDGSGQEDLIDE